MSAAKKTNTNPDTMTIGQALREPDREEFIKAMIKEIEDHTKRGHWEVVHVSTIPKGNKPISAIWSMKRNAIQQVTLLSGKQDCAPTEDTLSKACIIGTPTHQWYPGVQCVSH